MTDDEDLKIIIAEMAKNATSETETNAKNLLFAKYVKVNSDVSAVVRVTQGYEDRCKKAGEEICFCLRFEPSETSQSPS